MKKRIFLILLTSLMICCFVGCGKNTDKVNVKSDELIQKEETDYEKSDSLSPYSLTNSNDRIKVALGTSNQEKQVQVCEILLPVDYHPTSLRYLPNGETKNREIEDEEGSSYCNLNLIGSDEFLKAWKCKIDNEKIVPQLISFEKIGSKIEMIGYCVEKLNGQTIEELFNSYLNDDEKITHELNSEEHNAIYFNTIYDDITIYTVCELNEEHYILAMYAGPLHENPEEVAKALCNQIIK